MKEVLNNYCIVRGDRSGVFFGIVKNINGQTVELEKVRRLWYWDGANSISQLANKGTEKPKNCKFTVTVEKVILTDVIELNLCTQISVENIKSVPEWKY